jgi:hypothetical protein
MKVKINATPEQIELLKLTGNRDRSKAWPAMEAFAAILAPVVQVVLDKLSTVRSIYSVKTIGETDNAEFPLDVFFDEKDGDILVHFQPRPGGVPSSYMSGLETVIVPTAMYQSEVSWQNKFARNGRLDVVSAYIHKLGQAMVRKEEINGWTVLLHAAATSSTNSLSHTVTSTTTDGIFHLDLMNQMLTRAKRLNTSVGGGTAIAAPQGLTDIFLSVEAMADVRAFSYNPINVRGATAAAAAGDVVALPDDLRKDILAGAGMLSLMGITLHEMNELGLSQSYNTIFDSFFAGTFVPASDEVIIGVDMSRDSNVMPSKGGLVIMNDILNNRSDKSGVIAQEDIGFGVLDTRALVAGIIDG